MLMTILTSSWFVQIALWVIGILINFKILTDQNRIDFINNINVWRARGLADVKTRYNAEGQLERIDAAWDEIEKKEKDNGHI